jgi:hypothetical protein
MYKGDLERGMLKQQPTLNITRANQYEVSTQVDKVHSHSIQSTLDNIGEHYGLRRFEPDANRLECIDSRLVDNKHLCRIAKHVEGGGHIANLMQRVLNTSNERPACTILLGGSNPRGYLDQSLSPCELPR